MIITSGSTDRKIPFVAVDATDFVTRETGLSSFTVYRSRDGGAATVYTTPTVAEASAANMPGLYWLTIDEDTTLGASHDCEEYAVHITHAGMAPVTLALTIERPKFTEGQSATMANNAVDADIERLQGSVIATPTVAGVLEVDVTHWIGTAAATPTVAGVPEVDITHFNGVAGTFASGRPEVNVSHWRGTAAAVPTTAGVPAVEAVDISAAGQTDIRSAVGLATANLDTQLDALPTAAENADAVWDEDATAHQTTGTFGASIGDPSAFDDLSLQSLATSIKGDTGYIPNLANALNVWPGSAQSGTTTTLVDTSLTQADADYWKGNYVVFLTGSIAGQARLITGFNAGTDTLTFSPATTQSVGTNNYVILSNAPAPTAAENAAELLATATDGAVTVAQSLRLANSANGAKLSGAATTSIAIRDLADTKNRVAATVDADGNRTAVTLDLA